MPDDIKTFDDVLVQYGEFGGYQKLTYLLYCIPYIFASTQLMGWVFIGARPSRFACVDDFANETISFNSSSCPSNCSQFVYDTSVDTVVREWDLVCDREEMRARISSAPMLGILLGGIFFGPLSDKLGRKITFLLSTLIMFLSGVLTVFSPEYYTFLASRVLVGFSLPGIQTSCYVMGMEIVGPSKRGLAGLLCWYFESFGFLLTVALAYLYNTNWRILQAIYTLPLLMFIPYICIAPESPRWLLAHDKYPQASKIISKILNRNGYDGEHESQKIIQSLEKNAQDSFTPTYNLLHLFKYPHLRLKTLILNWLWIVTSSLYYVLLLDQRELSDNLYVGFTLTALVQIPGYVLIMFLLDRPFIGRKRSMIFMFVLTGLCLILHPLLPSDPKYTLVKVSLSLIGRFATNCAYTILCIFSSEQYPTVIRGIGFSFSFTVSKIGCIIGPYILMLGPSWPIVFGIGTLLGALFSVFLPETLGTQLPDTIEESENVKVHCPCLCSQGVEEEQTKKS